MRFVIDMAGGFRTALRGVTFLAQHRTLWKWALLPAVVNIIVFAAAFAVFLVFYPDLYGLATGFLPLDTPTTWYAWLWVAPLRLLALVIGLLLLITTLVVLYIAFIMLGIAIASPFLDVLAQRVEEIVTGPTPDERTTFMGALRAISASIVVELQKLTFFLAVQAVLFLLGLIPVLSPFTVMAATLFTLFFLPLEYAGFAMDHRHMRFPQRRALIWQHRWLMLGFGAAAFLTMLVPLLNFVCLPVLVVGGTLLIAECGTRRDPNTECGIRNAE
ncbi:Sulfate transporter CysZ [Candidatus Entotheonellaceae bacterium PAL068K]